MTPTLTPPPAAKRHAPDDASAFAEAHGLGGAVELAERLARDTFPPDSELELELARDCESDAEWLVLRVSLSAPPDAVLSAYTEFLERWTAAAPPRALDLIALCYAVR
jgi:hypothetical protein